MLAILKYWFSHLCFGHKSSTSYNCWVFIRLALNNRRHFAKPLFPQALFILTLVKKQLILFCLQNNTLKLNWLDCVSQDLEQRRMTLRPHPAASSVQPENISSICMSVIAVHSLVYSFLNKTPKIIKSIHMKQKIRCMVLITNTICSPPCNINIALICWDLLTLIFNWFDCSSLLHEIHNKSEARVTVVHLPSMYMICWPHDLDCLPVEVLTMWYLMTNTP